MTAAQLRAQRALHASILEGGTDCPVHRYAVEIADGDRVAGPYVRAQCKRHLDDLRNGLDRHWAWSPEKARDALLFFPNVLTLTGLSEGQPFELHPWQEFVIGSIFGWTDERTGRRRFRYAYIETAKGSGKTPLAAGVALYCLLRDSTPRAEVYISAATEEQSKITARDIVAMVSYSRYLSDQVKLFGGERMERLLCKATGSFLRPLPYKSSGAGMSGFRPHCFIGDEIHEHASDIMLERMTAGFKSDPDPLAFLITNSGSDKLSVCYQEREKAIRGTTGHRSHENRFGYVCALDEGDDPLNDEACWPKANPGLLADGGGIPGAAYIRTRVQDAEDAPATEMRVRQMAFCQWTESAAAWLKAGLWQKATRLGEGLRWADYEGAPCWAGLDLAIRRAFASLSLVFDSPEPDIDYDVFAMFWMGGDVGEAERRDKREGLYRRWMSGDSEDDRCLRASPGDHIDYPDIARELARIDRRFEVRGLAYDRYYMSVLESEFLRMSEPPKFPMFVHPQAFGAPAKPKEAASDSNGLYMPLSVKQTELALRRGRVRVAPNPMLTAHVASCMGKVGQVGRGEDPDRSDEIYLIPGSPTEYIDGAIAMVQAIGLAESDLAPASSWVFAPAE